MMSYSSEDYVDQGYTVTSEVKFDKDQVLISSAVVKREPEERNFSDHHVTGIKEEYEDQSQDLTFEIKFEEDPVPISFPVVKREPEEEQSDLDTVNEEPRVEGRAGDNEIFTECSDMLMVVEVRKQLKVIGIIWFYLTTLAKAGVISASPVCRNFVPQELFYMPVNLLT
ncbi:hypothetical protein ANN_27486 [Periplaneta americana]|uniref:Uncharacterized protein n=1 Tax=Periplaneta americana TaxID=6978 RepID=A0ABQ8RW02_PERAM|nr:hypothetical protein ANN_27486 [Periplaneta americana]